MSTLKHQEILAFAKSKVKNSTNLKAAISIALGIAISRSIQVPSSELDGVDDDAYSYYSTTVSYTAKEATAQFNENLLVDFNLTADVCRSFWLIRYFNAYPLKMIPLFSDEDGHFMNKLNGVGHLINPEVFCICQEESSTIISLVNKIREIIG